MKQTLSKHGIGGSDISVVVGLNPYKSPWDLWIEKVNNLPVPDSSFMEWGIRLEPAIRQKYVDATGEVVHVPDRSIFHPSIPWARATPDGIVLEDAHRISLWKHLLQCKNVGEWVGRDSWDEGPPGYVQLQEQWEMHVTGLSRADIAALIGGNDFRIYTVHRDPKAITDLVTIAEDFWRRVETKTPPPVDESDACKRHFEEQLAKVQPVELMADAESEDLMRVWHDLFTESKRIAKSIGAVRNRVLKTLADAQADRLVSSIGVAKLQANKTLRAPKAWGKETR